MIIVESQQLTNKTALAVNHFCQFTFRNIKFPNVVVKFETFDETYTTMATTDIQSIGLVITHNNPQTDLNAILDVLSHEAIHAYQLSDERLKYALMHSGRGVEWGFLWEGKPYAYPKTAREVIDLPWEREAYAQSQGVLDEYYNFYQKPLKSA